MRKLTSAICAAVMALSFPAAAPAIAMPVPAPAASHNAAQANVVDVQYRGTRRDWREREMRRDRGRRADRRFHRRGGHAYYRGHRGYRSPRAGYRRHNGFWFPPAAFIAGAIVGGAARANEPPVRYRPRGNRHIEWCYDRYRSYRESDNTFQPYNGPRRPCRSPYG